MAGSLAQQEAADVDAAYSDLQAGIAAGKADAKWLAGHKAGLRFLMAQWDKDEAALDAATTKATLNLDAMGEAFTRIKQRRKAWSLDNDMKAQIDRLTAIVADLARNQK